jgi:hypothetical protein
MGRESLTALTALALASEHIRLDSGLLIYYTDRKRSADSMQRRGSDAY